MDFVEVKEKINRSGSTEVYPNFRVRKSKDLMVRGSSFYAVWDEQKGMWSTDEYDVARLIDEELMRYQKNIKGNAPVIIKSLGDFSSDMWSQFKSYISKQPDYSRPLDEKLTFSNTIVKIGDYVSKRLDYPLEAGVIDAYEEMVSTLYEPEERAKLEWAIGAIVDGDSKDIQKFIVLYGSHGTGKSTMLEIIQKLFKGYYTTFEAKALASANNAFATEAFKNNPLIAIQHDGDLSKIEDNTKLNSIISHEVMTMNEKYKASYMSKTNCFLFMGTNKPVKITDAKSGIIRRLIDVKPSGNKIPPKRYQLLLTQINFELGAIASHCLEVYHKMGKNYYSGYLPINMIFQTDVFFNFVESSYTVFKEQNGASLATAYELYKQYCDDSLVDFKLPRYKFREELKSYFDNFYDVKRLDGKQIRSYYEGFQANKFKSVEGAPIEDKPYSMTLDCEESILDTMCANYPAQYASNIEAPINKWSNVKTKLKQLDTKKTHFIKMPENHIVIDFDIKDETGEKSYKKNIEIASKWPTTYAEISKSGAGIHLHYLYEGDVSMLSRVYDDNIEVKVFNGNSSLRRKLTKCNNIPVAMINSGLPLKGEKMINFDALKSEKSLRTLIKKNLNKEIHPGTKPSIDFIYKILDDAYKSEMAYDVTDFRPKILAFANNSSNQAEYCIKLVGKMQFKSEESSSNSGTFLESVKFFTSENPSLNSKDEVVFFDVEVFPNLFVVVWKAKGKQSIVMINPTPTDIEFIIKFKLIGFNCRRYDNHILYARMLGYTNQELYTLSQRIIGNSRNGLFSEAYNLSYADDFSSKKQSLKKFEIELGIHHQELGLPWDKDVPRELWTKVGDYCINDVVATEATFEARKQDFIARQILADLSGLSINDTTQMHTAKIIFGNDKRPQDKFKYTDLSIMFPGYKFDFGKSFYKGEETGEGGYIEAVPGMYINVALLDIASMHPTSLIEMDMFGPYTKNFKQLLDARIAIKHKNYDEAKTMLNGILAKYLTSEEASEDLSYALKIVINIVYGLTSAKFENKFKDPRNIDNIVAKRGALFMINLKHEVRARGYVVAHIKTDSIKIPDADEDIIKFVTEYGKKYGYDFEHEATYDRLCLVNDAVYIAKYDSLGIRTKGGKHANEWTATGTQFQQPFVFKTLFTKEPIVFSDMCETKTVTSSLYLDMNEELPDVSDYEKKQEIWNKKHVDSLGIIPTANLDIKSNLETEIARGHDYHFVGKAGSFCPIKPGCGGGLLMREKDGKYYAATGSKGYRWLESEIVESLKKVEDIDKKYYMKMVDTAVNDISKYCDFEQFISDEPYAKELPDSPPWFVPCGDEKYKTCFECPKFDNDGTYTVCGLGYNLLDQIPF